MAIISDEAAIRVVFVLWAASLLMIPEFLFWILQAALSVASYPNVSTQPDIAIDGFSGAELDFIHQATQRVLTTNAQSFKELRAKQRVIRVVNQDVASLRAALQSARARERKAASTLALAQHAKELSTLAEIRRLDKLRCEISETLLQAQESLASIVQTHVEVKTLQDTLATAEAEACGRAGCINENKLAKIAEAKMAIDQKDLMFVKLQAERRRLQEEAAQLKVITGLSAEKNERRVAEAVAQVRAAEGELARLAELERTLKAANVSAQGKNETHTRQIASVEAAIRDTGAETSAPQKARVVFLDTKRTELKAMEDAVDGAEAELDLTPVKGRGIISARRMAELKAQLCDHGTAETMALRVEHTRKISVKLRKTGGCPVVPDDTSASAQIGLGFFVLP